MVELPRWAATFAIDTAARPSASATATAARVMSASVSVGFGPRLDVSRMPQSKAMCSGSSVSSVIPLLVLLAESRRRACARLLRRCYANSRITYAVTEGRMIVEVHGLRKAYGDNLVLDGIDLHVPEGSVYALLGPNGAGKTTTVRILTTLTRPDAGRVLVAGHDVVREPAKVRARISLTGQYAAVDNEQTGRERQRTRRR